MKIGYFTPCYPGVTGEGGIGTYTRDLARGLARLGHEIHVVSQGKSPDIVCDGPVTVHVVATRRSRILDRLVPGAGFSIQLWRAMSKIVSEHGLEIVEFPNWEGFGWLFASFRSVPLVVRLSTSSLESQKIDGTPQSRETRWDVRREHWLARRADALVTHSHAHREFMADELGIAGDRIDVAPLGIPVFPDFGRIARRADDLTVLYLGRMEKRKGTIHLFDAIPRVLEAVPKARFIFIGSDRPHCPGGSLHTDYFRATYPDWVRERVQFLGRLPDEEVNRWLQTADVFVAPSLYESFGLIFPEAMRWGTPVIGTTTGGIPEIVEDEHSGVLVPVADSQALGAAIVDLLRDERRRTALGIEGRKRIESEFSVGRMAERAESLYQRTIDRARTNSRSLESQRRLKDAATLPLVSGHPDQLARAMPAANVGTASERGGR
jgi:glycosyltransferase involved in cell wall biosynthesis